MWMEKEEAPRAISAPYISFSSWVWGTWNQEKKPRMGTSAQGQG